MEGGFGGPPRRIPQESGEPIPGLAAEAAEITVKGLEQIAESRRHEEPLLQPDALMEEDFDIGKSAPDLAETIHQVQGNA